MYPQWPTAASQVMLYHAAYAKGYGRDSGEVGRRIYREKCAEARRRQPWKAGHDCYIMPIF